VTTNLKLSLLAKNSLADGVVQLTFGGAGELPTWEPGAHVDLHVGSAGAQVDGPRERQYSLCGDPADHSVYRVAVLREPDGRGGSRWVHDVLEPGATVELGGPRNNFELVEAPSYLFVAGGIGITPILAMIRQVATAGKPWRLLYGGRTRTSMAFVAELEGIDPGRCQVCPQDEAGLLDLNAALDRAEVGAAVYACGPEPLLVALEAAVAGRDVTLHLERFAPKDVVADGPDVAFEVELARTGNTVVVSPGVSLLDAIREAGAPVEFSCHEGTCGTCEVAVLDGVPDHRDSILNEEEQAANDVMFPCVSRSRSQRLVLDI
jgi:ferredoxin-NADP reductase